MLKKISTLGNLVFPMLILQQSSFKIITNLHLSLCDKHSLTLKIKENFTKIKANREQSQNNQSFRSQELSIRKQGRSQQSRISQIPNQNLKSQGIQHLMQMFGHNPNGKTRQQKLDKCLDIFLTIKQELMYPFFGGQRKSGYQYMSQIKLKKLFQYEQQQGIIDQILDHIILKFQNMTMRQQKILHNFFIFWGGLMNKMMVNKNYKIKKRTIFGFLQRWSYLIYLVTPTQAYTISHFRLIANFHTNYKQHWLNNQISATKYLLDNLITLEFSLRQLNYLAYFLSRFYIYSLSFENADLLMKYLLDNSVKHDYISQLDRFKTIGSSFARFGVYNKKLIEDLKHTFYSTNYSSKHVFYAFIYLLEFKQITAENITKTDLQIIQNAYNVMSREDSPFYFFEGLFRQMYRAGIWDQKFWFEFFDFLLQGQNYKSFYIYDLFIDNDIIPVNVVKRGNQAFAELKKKHGVRIENVNITEIWGKKYKNAQVYGKKTESFIANSLRLANKGKIQTQAKISFIHVDMLINDKYVIEVNNLGHYLRNFDEVSVEKEEQSTVLHNFDVDVKTTNLKTSLRERILQKLGYKIMSIKIKDHCEANFEFINKIYDQIDLNQR